MFASPYWPTCVPQENWSVTESFVVNWRSSHSVRDSSWQISFASVRGVITKLHWTILNPNHTPDNAQWAVSLFFLLHDIATVLIVDKEIIHSRKQWEREYKVDKYCLAMFVIIEQSKTLSNSNLKPVSFLVSYVVLMPYRYKKDRGILLPPPFLQNLFHLFKIFQDLENRSFNIMFFWRARWLFGKL